MGNVEYILIFSPVLIVLSECFYPGSVNQVAILDPQMEKCCLPWEFQPSFAILIYDHHL